MKISALIAIAAVAGFGLTGSAFAQTAVDNFGGNGNAWTEDYDGHFVNNNNPDNRKDLNTGRKAVPGNAAQAQADNPSDNDSAHNVISRPGDTLVDPNRSLE